jgi:hypothetical protein
MQLSGDHTEAILIIAVISLGAVMGSFLRVAFQYMKAFRTEASFTVM